VDAVNATNNQTAVVRMSIVTVSILLLPMGIEPVMQMVCRIIPPELIKRMSDAPKGKGSEVGLAICAEIIEQLRAIEGVAGIHIMAIEWEQKVREIVETAKLLPRPVV
jgi:5,10-methylenetetrahydrofolate reductase